MKFTPEVVAALAVLREHAENDFERHRLDVLERDLTAPPTVEIIDEHHQKFNGFTFTKYQNGHYNYCISIQRAVWSYYVDDIPIGDYIVHHRDLNKSNNDISNFQLMTKKEHQILHKEIELSRTQKPKETQFCRVCGKTFEIKHYGQTFCSSSCASKAVWEQRYRAIREPRHCVICGKLFFVNRKNSKQQCCSLKCGSILSGQKHRKKQPVKTCPICGKEFTQERRRKNNCCSRSCSSKLSIQTRRAKKIQS